MQTLSQIETNDTNIIKSILDQEKISDSERYKQLLTYYSKLPPEDSHFFHAVILAEVLIKQRTKNNKQFYKYRLTQKQRKDLFRFLISKDILLRRGTPEVILEDYLKSSSVFEMSRQEIKELVRVYFDPAVQSSATKKIDKYFDEKDRGVSNKFGPTNKDSSDPEKLLSPIRASGKNDPSSLQADPSSLPITPQTLDRLRIILQSPSPTKRYQELVNFIKSEVSPFDAKRIAYQLKYVDRDLQKAFLKSFPFGHRSTNNILSLLTKIGNGDQGLYEIRSIFKPGLVVRKKIIEIFTSALSKAFKKEDNPGAGPEFEPVIRLINQGTGKKGMTADEVRICLIIFLRLLKEFKLPKLARHGERTMQVFTELIEQGARMAQYDYLDDFVEMFYKKLVTDLAKPLPADELDDIQLYYLSLEETIGAISGKYFQSRIYSALYDSNYNRKNNRRLSTSMVDFLVVDYRNKNPEIGKISLSDLASFDPFYDKNMHEKVKQLLSDCATTIDGVKFTNIDKGFDRVETAVKRYRDFLKSQTNELILFQILKWAGDYLNDTLDKAVARELYLETYISIIWHAYNTKNLLSYGKGLPKMDLNLFIAQIKPASWGIYKIDYLDRLRYSSQYIVNSQELTLYMLRVHILARDLELTLVNNTEREMIRELRLNNSDLLKQRVFRPRREFINLNVWKEVHIDEKFSNFKVYYISDPNEVRDYTIDRFDEDKANEAKISNTKSVYLLHSNIPNFLFAFDRDYNQMTNFLMDQWINLVYQYTKGIEIVLEHFFKYLVYLPVLVEYGLVAAITEIAVDRATEEVVKQIAPDSAGAQFLASIIAGHISTPGLKGLRTPKADKILRKQTLDELSESGARFRGTTNAGTDLNDVLTGSKQPKVGGADINPRQRANTPLVDTILDKLPEVEDFAAKVSKLTDEDWNRLAQTPSIVARPQTIGEWAQQYLHSAKPRGLASQTKYGDRGPDYPILAMLSGEKSFNPSGKSIEDVRKWIRNKNLKWKEKPVERGLGTRWVDENNVERIRLMREKDLGKFVHEEKGYWRLQSQNGYHLNQNGEVPCFREIDNQGRVFLRALDRNDQPVTVLPDPRKAGYLVTGERFREMQPVSRDPYTLEEVRRLTHITASGPDVF